LPGAENSAKIESLPPVAGNPFWQAQLEFRASMVFPNIEQFKREYTDKYVVVDPQRPELARFANVVGQVKTVNMSGRALVEFQDYHLNIGWYDIDLNYLKIVDKPLPKPKDEAKPAAKAEAKKPAEAKVPTPAAKPAASGKASTADILAKLRGGGGAAPAVPAPKKETAPAAESKPAAASGAKLDRSKMSVAEMLAAARGGAAAAPAKAPAAPEAEATAKEEATPSPAKSAPAQAGIVKVDKSKMSLAEMIAYCREHDTK
jgi:hypothetical protein